MRGAVALLTLAVLALCAEVSASALEQDGSAQGAGELRPTSIYMATHVTLKRPILAVGFDPDPTFYLADNTLVRLLNGTLEAVKVPLPRPEAAESYGGLFLVTSGYGVYVVDTGGRLLDHLAGFSPVKAGMAASRIVVALDAARTLHLKELFVDRVYSVGERGLDNWLVEEVLGEAVTGVDWFNVIDTPSGSYLVMHYTSPGGSRVAVLRVEGHPLRLTLKGLAPEATYLWEYADLLELEGGCYALAYRGSEVLLLTLVAREGSARPVYVVADRVLLGADVLAAFFSRWSPGEAIVVTTNSVYKFRVDGGSTVVAASVSVGEGLSAAEALILHGAAYLAISAANGTRALLLDLGGLEGHWNQLGGVRLPGSYPALRAGPGPTLVFYSGSEAVVMPLHSMFGSPPPQLVELAVRVTLNGEPLAASGLSLAVYRGGREVMRLEPAEVPALLYLPPGSYVLVASSEALGTLSATVAVGGPQPAEAVLDYRAYRVCVSVESPGDPVFGLMRGPVAGARVVLEPLWEGPPRYALATGDGGSACALVREGVYAYVAEAPGYECRTGSLTVAGPANVTLALRPRLHELSLTVLDEATGRPVPAAITVVPQEPAAEAVVYRAATYPLILRLPAATYEVSVEAEGFKPEVLTGVTPPANLTVRLSREVVELKLTVVDELGPAPGAYVNVTSLDTGESFVIHLMDAEGEVLHLQTGDYAFTVFGDYWEPTSAEVRVTSLTETVELEARRRFVSLTLDLVDGYTGEPVRGVRAEAVLLDPPQNLTLALEPGATLRVPAGVYRVTVPGTATHVGTSFREALLEDAELRVELGRRFYVLTVRVLDEEGTPLDAARISLRGKETGRELEIPVRGGVLEIMLPADTYEVSAFARWFRAGTETVLLAAPRNVTLVLERTAVGALVANLKLLAAASALAAAGALAVVLLRRRAPPPEELEGLV